MRRVRIDRRLAEGNARRCSSRRRRRSEGPAGRTDRPGIDLRPDPTRRRGRRRRRGAPLPATPRSRAMSSTAPSCWRPRRSRSACSSPPTRSRRSGRRCACAGLPAGRAGRTPRRRLGHGRGDDHPDEEDPDQEGRPDDVRHARRPRGVGRADRVRQRAGRRRRALVADSIVLVRGRVDHKDRETTCVIVQQVEPLRAERRGGRGRPERGRRRPAHPRRRCGCVSMRPRCPRSALADLKELLAGFPGDCRGRDRAAHVDRADASCALGAEFRVAQSAGAARRARRAAGGGDARPSRAGGGGRAGRGVGVSLSRHAADASLAKPIEIHEDRTSYPGHQWSVDRSARKLRPGAARPRRYCVTSSPAPT